MISSSKRKITKIIVLSLFILGLFVCNFPFPIQKTYHAIEINMADATVEINRTIKIKGYYHLNLFSNDKFEGTFNISGYEKVIGNADFGGIEISRKGKTLYYINRNSNIPEHIVLGELYSGFMLSDMIIGYVIDENGKNNSTFTCNVIVTNTGSRQSAYETALKLFEAE